MKKLALLVFLIPLTSCQLPKVVSSNFSKEFCSCLFVVKRSEDLCYKNAKQFIAPTSYKIDHEKKMVVANFIGSKTTVRYTEKRYGCQIVN